MSLSMVTVTSYWTSSGAIDCDWTYLLGVLTFGVSGSTSSIISCWAGNIGISPILCFSLLFFLVLGSYSAVGDAMIT